AAAGRPAVAAHRVPLAPARHRVVGDAVPGRRGRRARRQAGARLAAERARQAPSAEPHPARGAVQADRAYQVTGQARRHRHRVDVGPHPRALAVTPGDPVKAFRWPFVVCGVGLGLIAVPAGAVVTATWNVETYQQWDAGDATSAFITSTGELRPGWDTKRTPLEGDAVWSSLRLADGSVLLGSDAGGA